VRGQCRQLPDAHAGWKGKVLLASHSTRAPFRIEGRQWDEEQGGYLHPLPQCARRRQPALHHRRSIST